MVSPASSGALHWAGSVGLLTDVIFGLVGRFSFREQLGSQPGRAGLGLLPKAPQQAGGSASPKSLLCACVWLQSQPSSGLQGGQTGPWEPAQMEPSFHSSASGNGFGAGDSLDKVPASFPGRAGLFLTVLEQHLSYRCCAQLWSLSPGGNLGSGARGLELGVWGWIFLLQPILWDLGTLIWGEGLAEPCRRVRCGQEGPARSRCR